MNRIATQNGPALLAKLEDEGLESHDEAVIVAEYLIESGLVNSTGSYQRFVRNVLGD